MPEIFLCKSRGKDNPPKVIEQFTTEAGLSSKLVQEHGPHRNHRLSFDSEVDQQQAVALFARYAQALGNQIRIEPTQEEDKNLFLNDDGLSGSTEFPKAVIFHVMNDTLLTAMRILPTSLEDTSSIFE
jgi:hypothetical protein